MRLVFAGTPAAAVPSLRALLDSRHDVVAVLTRPPARAGRGRLTTPSPVSEMAAATGVPVLAPATLSDPEFADAMERLAPDCCPVVAFGSLVPPRALAIPRHGWVNLHFSLLPAWRGAAPVQWALLAGDDITGATTFRLEQGLDTGPTFGVVTEAVRATDTAADLIGRLAVSGAGLLVATVDGIEDGTVHAVPQPTDGVSAAPKLEPGDARVQWARPALAIDRLVRACTPSPGAWTQLRGQRVKLGPVRLPDDQSAASRAPAEHTDDLEPGQIGVRRTAVAVGTGSGAVLLGDVTGQGKRPMPALDWTRGLRLQPGERFET